MRKFSKNLRGDDIMPGGFQLPKLVNGEEVWKLWHGVDQPTDLSLSQIYAKYQREGNVNPKTGLPVTRTGLGTAAWLWALDHMDVAIPSWISAWEGHGDFYTREDALRIFVSRARKCYTYSKTRFNKFIEKHNLQEYV
jgi:hypothetical protein